MPDILAVFFLVALVTNRLGVDLRLPDAAYQLLTYILLITIGLKGGQAISANTSFTLVGHSVVVMFLGVVLMFVALALIHLFSNLNKADKVSLAAHYGSVSVGTFAVAVSYLEVNNIEYSSVINLFVALLELPAIVVGLWLLSDKQSKVNLRTILAHKSLALIVMGMFIGALYGDVAQPMIKNLQPMFGVMLALYLIHMGALAGEQLDKIGPNKIFICLFALVMPLVGAAIAFFFAMLMQLDVGTAALLATLGASASYIAVPAVFSQVHPEANISQALVASLAITFSFNVILGIKWYTQIAFYLYS
ncbi:sodium-dependent bicarbonate transport family permease [Algibacillus agarilyticus]|uniref:sodium-dependent bicarbonate transport family permease n=1 Tax=Algibacillus agarilyticus TaxID=2234133 RepID=UPI0013008E9C|nr:sodium-dependent bicarbonate transport family permease [Algibacillus agarilyticus]